MRKENVLWRRVHQVEFTLVFQNAGGTRVIPDESHRISDLWIQGYVWVRVYVVFHDVCEKIADSLAGRLDVEVVVRLDEGLGTVEKILVNSQAIKRELFDTVSILVNNFHLFDDG
jgi:hypothetical protein